MTAGRPRCVLRDPRSTVRRSPRGDAGLTLIELLVTMILMGVVSSLVVGAVAQAARVVAHTEDEETGLQDAKVILDRIGRDIRESRGVVCVPTVADPACLGHLQLWVDANSDYVQQSSTEVVTWELRPNPDGVHSDVWRTVGLGSTTDHLQASSLIVNAIFDYQDADGASTTAAAATEVQITLSYDSMVNRGAGVRSVQFSASLRNKE